MTVAGSSPARVIMINKLFNQASQKYEPPTHLISRLVRDGQTYVIACTNDPDSYAIALDTMASWMANEEMRFGIGDCKVMTDNLNDQMANLPL